MAGGVPTDSGATGMATGAAGGAGATAADGATNAGLTDGGTAGAPIDALVGADAGRLPYHAIGVATGENHVCALLDDHRVKCWGYNNLGQLGYGDTQTRGASPSEMGDALPTVDLGTGRTARAIAAGFLATCAILDDGSIKCWGSGELTGQPPVNGVAMNIGDEPGELGDNLPALDFGGRKAVNLAVGRADACASMDDETIWCWGESVIRGLSFTPGQQMFLPAKPVRMLSPMGDLIVALYGDGTLSPPLPPEVGDYSLTFMSDHEIVAVVGGEGDATCVLFDDATTACQQGWAPVSFANVVAIGAEPNFGIGLCVALPGGDVQCLGQACGPPFQCSPDGSSFALGASVSAMTVNGDEFVCALLADGSIKCWSDPSDATSPPLGAEFDVTTQPSGNTVYGAWHSVDLGTH